MSKDEHTFLGVSEAEFKRWAYPASLSWKLDRLKDKAFEYFFNPGKAYQDNFIKVVKYTDEVIQFSCEQIKKLADSFPYRVDIKRKDFE